MHGRRAALVFSMIGLVLSAGQSVRNTFAQPSSAEGLLRFAIPLTDGQLNVRDLLTNLCDTVGLSPPAALQELDWSIDVQSTFGRLQLQAIRTATGGSIEIDVDERELVVTIDRSHLESVRDQIKPQIEAWLGDLLGRAITDSQRNYGLSFVTDADERAGLSALPSVPTRVVVLVHGLDDPGWMWRDVIPALRAVNHTVARFEYPNDGPVADSADMLALALSRLRTAGVEHTDLVAHSMGGLVARDVLTRTSYYHGDGSGGERFPAIDRLIMIGTPHAGSHMVRFRGVTELKDQLYRAWHGEHGWLNSIADGQGEAGEDLLPGSVFLSRLNARPLATHTRYTIIAGRISPVSETKLREMADSARRLASSGAAPSWLQRLAESGESELVLSVLGSAIRGLGDGVVTVSSAQLAGVDDFQVVEADHLSLIVNVLPSDRTPPAIPIILERFQQSGPE